jgi:hypothetical protein
MTEHCGDRRQRRPRPDLGCSAIGWKDEPNSGIVEVSSAQTVACTNKITDIIVTRSPTVL